MKKMIMPALFVIGLFIAWSYFAPETVPVTPFTPDAVNAGQQAGQSISDHGKAFYDSPYWWPFLVCGGLAALGIMFWRNIGKRAQFIVLGLAVAVVTILVMRGAK